VKLPAGAPKWMELYAPAPEGVPTDGLLPPQDRERNHAAETLITILTDDSFDALVEMCRVPRIRRVVRILLAELCRARLHSILGIQER
jgi:hypothetical protein